MLLLGILVLLSLTGGILLALIITHLPNVRLTPNDKALVTLVATVLGFQGAAIVWVHFFLRKHEISWGEGFGFAHRNFGQCVIIVLLALPVVLAGVVVLGKASEWVLLELHGHLRWEWLKPQSQSAVQLLQEQWPVSLVALQGFVALVVAPVAEELLFRGVLYQAIKQRSHRQAALWITAILFAMIHFYPVGFLSLIFLAVILVFVYERTKNLFAPILLHSLFNTVNFILIVTQPKWAQDLFKT